MIYLFCCFYWQSNIVAFISYFHFELSVMLQVFQFVIIFVPRSQRDTSVVNDVRNSRSVGICVSILFPARSSEVINASFWFLACKYASVLIVFPWIHLQWIYIWIYPQWIYIKYLNLYLQWINIWIYLHRLVVSDLRSETRGSRFESGCYLCAEESSL